MTRSIKAFPWRIPTSASFLDALLVVVYIPFVFRWFVMSTDKHPYEEKRQDEKGADGDADD